MPDEDARKVLHCLGCAEDVEAEYEWHDGLYRSPYCRDHVKDMLPEERALEDTTVVSGFAIHRESREKLVVKDDLG